MCSQSGILRLTKDEVDMDGWKRHHTRLSDDFMIDVQFRVAPAAAVVTIPPMLTPGEATVRCVDELC